MSEIPLGSVVAIKMDEPPHPCHSSLPNRNSSISPTQSIQNRDVHDSGDDAARRLPQGDDAARRLPQGMPAVVALDDNEVDEDEVEQGRPAHTRKPPVGMTPAEMKTHALTHIPFHPGCRSCVAGRKRDHQHLRRSGLEKMHQYLDAANARISADYFSPKGAPGHNGGYGNCHT